MQDLIKGSDAKPSVELNLMLREGEKKEYKETKLRCIVTIYIGYTFAFSLLPSGKRN